MPTLVIKKAAAGDLTIADTGVIIPGASSETFTDDNLIRDLARSKNLRDYILAGTLVVNDGLQDLSFYAGLIYIDNLWRLIGFDFGPFPVGCFAYHPQRMRRQYLYQQNAGLSSVVPEGYSTSPSTSGTLANSEETEGQFLQATSNAVTNSDAGWGNASFIAWPRDVKPILTFRIKTGASLANVRLWAGIFSASPMASAQPGAHLAGFRYDTGADATAFWRTVTAANAGVWSTTTTTYPIATNTVYELTVDCSDLNNVRFYIDGTLVATHAAQLPGLGTNLNWICYLRTLENVAKVIKISRIYIEHN